MNLIADRTELVIEECWCGIQHAVPKSLRDRQQRQFNNGESQTPIYCPLGHNWVRKGKSRCDELSATLQRQIACTDRVRANLRDTEASLSATRGVVTRIKKRINAGLCPCCKRNFVNLGKHMRGQHPKYVNVP